MIAIVAILRITASALLMEIFAAMTVRIWRTKVATHEFAMLFLTCSERCSTSVSPTFRYLVEHFVTLGTSASTALRDPSTVAGVLAVGTLLSIGVRTMRYDYDIRGEHDAHPQYCVQAHVDRDR